MTRKIARPTDSAGKVMWNAAVVANCQRDRSTKVCDVIFSVFLERCQTVGELRPNEDGRTQAARSWLGPGRQRSRATRTRLASTMVQSAPLFSSRQAANSATGQRGSGLAVSRGRT